MHLTRWENFSCFPLSSSAMPSFSANLSLGAS
jgi:hypothetical protein